jgi:hypothetical protein
VEAGVVSDLPPPKNVLLAGLVAMAATVVIGGLCIVGAALIGPLL